MLRKNKGLDVKSGFKISTFIKSLYNTIIVFLPFRVTVSDGIMRIFWGGDHMVMAILKTVFIRAAYGQANIGKYFDGEGFIYKNLIGVGLCGQGNI